MIRKQMFQIKSNLNKTKGQSTLEFAVLAFCLVAALVMMRVYVKRGIQGRLRNTADDIGIQYGPGGTTGRTSQVLSRTTQVQVYTELGTATLPGSGETVNGRYTYKREDISEESLVEDVDETVH